MKTQRTLVFKAHPEQRHGKGFACCLRQVSVAGPITKSLRYAVHLETIKELPGSEPDPSRAFCFFFEATTRLLALELRAVSAHTMFSLEMLIRHANAQKPTCGPSSDAPVSRLAADIVALKHCPILSHLWWWAGEDWRSQLNGSLIKFRLQLFLYHQAIMEYGTQSKSSSHARKFFQSFWQARNQPVNCPGFISLELR